MLTELEVVEMPGLAILEHENEFGLGTVKGAHPWRGFGPGHNVLEFRVDGFAGGAEFVKMSPINEDIMDRAIGGMLGSERKRLRQKLNVLCRRHFSRSLHKLAMFDFASSLNRADSNVIRNVREHHAGTLIGH